MKKRKPPPNPWWWIMGHHAAADVWLPLYNFKPTKRHLARGMLGYLLNAEPGSKLAQDHIEYDDFTLQPPDDEDAE